ncbi:MAG: methionyl-tRNA formyltransferase [Chloroflexota bacterium]
MTPGAEPDGATLVRTVFFGSGTFAVAILGALVERSDLELVGVITPTDRPVGRRGVLTPVPVASEALRRGVPLMQVDRVRSADAVDRVRALAPGLCVLADFGQLIPQSLLDLPRLGFINVHPSLLPQYRGASPIPATIAAGDPVAGVSVMRMDVGLDTGPVIGRRSWPLEEDEDTPGLEARAASEGARLLADTLPAVLRGEAPGEPQDPQHATLTRPLRREDGRLDPGCPADSLERSVRALRPWPGCFVELEGTRLAVKAASVGPSNLDDIPGRIVGHGDGIALATVEGRLVLGRVQPAGRREMAGAAFRLGHPMLVGSVVKPAPVDMSPAAIGRMSVRDDG